MKLPIPGGVAVSVRKAGGYNPQMVAEREINFFPGGAGKNYGEADINL
jgi:hypothetical protein